MTTPSSSNPGKIAVAILLFCLAIAAAWAGWLARESQAEAQRLKTMTLLDEPRPLPGFSLVDHRGEPITETALSGEWHLLFFGFTHCPAICPNTLALLDNVSQADEFKEAAPQVVLITVDPERDTPQRMNGYLAGFNPDFQGITGPADDLSALRKALFVPAKRIDTENGYTMDHGSAVVVVNPDGAVAGYFTPPHESESMISDLHKLISAG